MVVPPSAMATADWPCGERRCSVSWPAPVFPRAWSIASKSPREDAVVGVDIANGTPALNSWTESLKTVLKLAFCTKICIFNKFCETLSVTWKKGMRQKHRSHYWKEAKAAYVLMERKRKNRKPVILLMCGCVIMCHLTSTPVTHSHFNRLWENPTRNIALRFWNDSQSLVTLKIKG